MSALAEQAARRIILRPKDIGRLFSSLISFSYAHHPQRRRIIAAARPHPKRFERVDRRRHHSGRSAPARDFLVCHRDRCAESSAPPAALEIAAMPSFASPCLQIAIASTLLLAACGQENRYVAPPPPRVTVAIPAQQSVTRYLEATGNTAAVNSADLVARVSGFIQEINYQDGALVKKGAPLFTIEPEPYRIKLDQAKAAEAGARSALKQAQADLDRQTQLVARQAGTQATLDQSQATRDTSQA